jgi:hypothetical protein
VTGFYSLGFGFYDYDMTLDFSHDCRAQSENYREKQMSLFNDLESVRVIVRFSQIRKYAHAQNASAMVFLKPLRPKQENARFGATLIIIITKIGTYSVQLYFPLT